MADCHETISQLYAYLDEMLDEVLKADIARHLGDCPDCQGRVEFEYSLKLNIRARAQEEPVPDELRQRLLACFNLDLEAE